MACEPTEFTYTIDIQADPGRELRDFTNSAGIRVLGGQRTLWLVTSLNCELADGRTFSVQY